MLTVDEVLSLPELGRGAPEVVAGAAGLDTVVRWVHVSELPDIASLPSGGELILTTGVALPTRRHLLTRYVDELSTAMVSGLVVALGRAFEQLPAELVEAAERCGLPLVALRRQVCFVRVTHEVTSAIMEAQIAELRASEEINQVFTELGLEGASAQQIVGQVATMVGGPVVLENLAHQVLAVQLAGRPAEDVLRDWEQRSRARPTTNRTSLVNGWLLTAVGARGEQWGRLIVLLPEGTTTRAETVLERGASALALHRLVEGDCDSLERHTHGSLVTDILRHNYSSSAEALLRAQALGVPMVDRLLAGLVVRAEREPLTALEKPACQRGDAEQVATAARDAGVAALVSAGEDAVDVLLSLDPDADLSERAETLARAIHRRCSLNAPGRAVTIGLGAPVTAVRDLTRSWREASQVADATRGARADKLYYELPDVRIHGLLHLLRDDARLQTFVEREIGTLLAHDETNGTALTDLLGIYLDAGRNKTATAQQAKLSRPALYHRLERIEELLDTELESVHSCLSLHVALLALSSLRADQPEVRNPRGSERSTRRR